jgi:integrase
MPRRSAGPKLWFDNARETWSIVDGKKKIRTGFGATEADQAQKALAEYIGEKHVIRNSPEPHVADILNEYLTEHLSGKVSEAHIVYSIDQLARWWGTKALRDVTAANCRAYAAHRKADAAQRAVDREVKRAQREKREPDIAGAKASAPTASASTRSELAFLRAAIAYWHRERGPLAFVPAVVLPPPPEARIHFLTRSEAARFLWIARKTPHLARFFLLGWYTGSRRAVLTGLRWSMVDLETGVMTRKPHGAARTKKKAPPVRVGSRLLSHLRRWKRLDGDKGDYIVNFKGQPIFRPLHSWERVRVLAGLPDYVTPHILRHSRATHMLRQGVDPWQAAGALGMSIKMLTERYGHHHPDWQGAAAEAR